MEIMEDEAGPISASSPLSLTSFGENVYDPAASMDESQSSMNIIILPSVPTHPVSFKTKRITEEEALASDDDDGEDDDENDSDFVESSGGKKRKKAPGTTTSNRSGKSYVKASDKKAEGLIDTVISLHQRGETADGIVVFLKSFNFNDKTLGDLKQSMRRKMASATKGLSASAAAMLTYLSALPNEHPDKTLDLELRNEAMSYEELVKRKSAHDDQIRECELNLAVLKEQSKIYKFACEVHRAKTISRDDAIKFIYNKLGLIEDERFEAMAETISANRTKLFMGSK